MFGPLQLLVNFFSPHVSRTLAPFVLHNDRLLMHLIDRTYHSDILFTNFAFVYLEDCFDAAALALGQAAANLTVNRLDLVSPFFV